MQFGSKNEFAIECFHEPEYPNTSGWVFGRMCVWCRGSELGNLTEPACMLNVTEGHIKDCLAQLHDESLIGLTDDAIFALLNAAIYGDHERSNLRIVKDFRRYRKFEFLTGWGESFDVISGFMIQEQSGFRILYQQRSEPVAGVSISRALLKRVLVSFLEWIATEKLNVPTGVATTERLV